jgi:O-antigen ligase
MYGVADISYANAGLDSSNIDRYAIVIFIIVAFVILTKRSIDWGSAIGGNPAISFFFAYSAFSMLWSDTPMTVFTFWHRMLEQVLMVLIVLTEANPVKAFQALFRRTAYILIPWSVLLIKWYPGTGRRFSVWGAGQNVGVTIDKNKLGLLAAVTAMFLLSCLLAEWKDKSPLGLTNRKINFIVFGMAAWILGICGSSNAQIAALIGMIVVCLFQKKVFRLHFTTFLMVLVPLLAFLMIATDISSLVLTTFGEDETLTGRTDLWATLRAMPLNPLIGYGFESFWRGERYALLQQQYWWAPNQAHNAYLEMYLNLGLLGLAVQFTMLIVCYVGARKALLAATPASGMPDPDEDASARFKSAFLVAFIVYGWAESTFKGHSYGFFLFLMIAMQYVPQRIRQTTRSSIGSVRTERHRVNAM